MRTTLTLDDDVAHRIKKKRRAGNDLSFKEVVNQTLRNGLIYEEKIDEEQSKPFKLSGRLLESKMPFNFDRPRHLLEAVDEEHDLK